MRLEPSPHKGDARRPELLAEDGGAEHVRLGHDPLPFRLERAPGDEQGRTHPPAPVVEIGERLARSTTGRLGDPSETPQIGGDAVAACAQRLGLSAGSARSFARSRPRPR